jgi:hypothetical protein
VIVDFSSYPLDTQLVLANRFGARPTSYVMRFDVVHEAKSPDQPRPSLGDWDSRVRPQPGGEHPGGLITYDLLADDLSR